MNAQINTAIQNLLGRFVHCWNRRDFGGCAALFSGAASARFQAPDDKVCLIGKSTIAEELGGSARRMGFPFLLSHTPALRIPDDEHAMGSWYVSTIQLTAKGAIQGSARLDGAFLREGEGWALETLQFYYMMTLEPQPYPQGDPASFRAQDVCLPDPSAVPIAPEDFLELQRGMGRWCHNRRRGAEDWFSSDFPEISLTYPPLLPGPCRGQEGVRAGLERLRELEAAAAPVPLTIPMLTTPVLETRDGQAWGSWFVLSCDYLPGEAPAIAHRIGQLLARWRREDGRWRLLSLELRPLLELPPSPLLLEASDDTILRMEGSWLDAPEPTGRDDPAAVEDALLLEEYVAFWVSGLRYRSEAPFYYQRLAIDYPDLLRYRLGRRPVKEGLQAVTDEIFAMTSKFSTLQPKAPGCHIGTTPVIEISADGKRAAAVWLDYGWTTVAEVFGITRPPYLANPAIARYEHHYLKTPEGWKLYDFHWAPFYRVDKWTFDYAHTKGWSGTTSPKRFPLPLEPYCYEDDPARRGQPVVLEAPMIQCPYERPWTGGTDTL